MTTLAPTTTTTTRRPHLYGNAHASHCANESKKKNTPTLCLSIVSAISPSSSSLPNHHLHPSSSLASNLQLQQQQRQSLAKILHKERKFSIRRRCTLFQCHSAAAAAADIYTGPPSKYKQLAHILLLTTTLSSRQIRRNNGQSNFARTQTHHSGKSAAAAAEIPKRFSIRPAAATIAR